MDDLEPRGEPRPASASSNARGEPPVKPDSHRRWLWRVVALLALLLLAGTTIAVLTRRPHTGLQPTPAAQPTQADTDAPFPSDTASDVVSYADHVALVTAIAEADAPPTSRMSSPDGEHVVMRQVTFRVDHTLWSRPDAPTAPKQLTARWWGWLLRNGKRTPFIVHGAPAVFLGAQYVMPVAYDGREFSVIQPFAAFRFTEGRVVLEEQDTPLARAIAQASQRDLVEIFSTAVPDPVASRYRQLLPRARLAAVLAARSR